MTKNKIHYIDRETGKCEEEKVYGANALKLLYGDSRISKFFGSPIRWFVSKLPLFSSVYGFWQKLPFTRKKIAPFIQEYGIDASEFLDDPKSFRCFNDFFIRKLKPEARPLASDSPLIIPADGRYFFYQNIAASDGFIVKGKKFDLTELLQDRDLAEKYAQGSMMMARLCPTDYHRYHFPCDCVPGEARLINGYLYSVNPLAVRQNVSIFTENKRKITRLQTELFGEILYIEVGATNVGTIHQTYCVGESYVKGDEKGYFSFGGSALILLFEPGRVSFSSDLLEANAKGLEVKCLFGQSCQSF